jgi:hypothetical protein
VKFGNSQATYSNGTLTVLAPSNPSSCRKVDGTTITMTPDATCATASVQLTTTN